MSKEGKEIKITDKRMFTPDGELREEYRFLEEKSNAAAPPADASATAAATGAPPPPAGQPPAAQAGPGPRHPDDPRSEPPAAGAEREPAGGAGRRGQGRSAPASGGASGRRAARRDEPPPEPDPMGESARLEIPGSPPGLGPSFYDLASMLAEPVAVYLGDMELPDGQTAENLEMARLYIDLLDVLRQKTAGNLTAQESAFLEDLLYRLRVRYVQKRG